MKTELILKELEGFHGTENWIQIPFSNYNFTDGINKLVEVCKCYWLISDLGIELAQKKELQKPFILVKIEVSKNKQALITLREDSNLKPFFSKEYQYTDFPLKEFEFYICDNTFLLKSEY